MKTSKRITAMLLCVLLVAGLLGGIQISAGAAGVTVRMWDTYWDEASAVNLWGGGTIKGKGNFLILYTAQDTMLYCIEPGMSLTSGDALDLNDYVNTLRTPSIHEDFTVTRLLGRLFQYIDYDKTGLPFYTDEGRAQYIAARVLVWELTQGERDAEFNHVTPPAGYDPVLQSVYNSNMQEYQKSAIYRYYDYFVDAVKNHHKIPTFAGMSAPYAPSYELTSNGGTLSVTLTDNNRVLDDFDFASDNGDLSFSKNWNELTVTARNAFDGEILVSTSKGGTQRGVICYGDGAGSKQDVVAVGTPLADPMRAYFKLSVSVGNLTIIKTTQNNDGNVGGFQFRVTKQDGAEIGTYTTDSSGRVDIQNLAPGVYTVEEINLPTEFVTPEPNPKTITVISGQTVIADFNNVRKSGVITIRKTNADPAMGWYSLAGAVFEVRTSDGTLVDTVTTNADGTAQTRALPLGSYYITEKTAPRGFVLNSATYTVTLSGNLGAGEIVYAPDVIVYEQPQVGTITITKSDKAAGDASIPLAFR